MRAFVQTVTIVAVLLLLAGLPPGPASLAWAQETPESGASALRVGGALAPRLVTAEDDPDDKAGSTLIIKWKAPKETRLSEREELVGYQVLTAELGKDGQPKEFEAKANVDAATTEASVPEFSPLHSYMVKVAAFYAPPDSAWHPPGEQPPEDAQQPVEAKAAETKPIGPVRPVGLWYDGEKTNVLVGLVLYSLIVVLCFVYAQRGDMYIRPIAGLEAVEDAIGRATEMGKPMLFVPGLTGIGSISTIASILILGHLAKRTAAYDTPILAPCNDPLVMAAEREVVREAYIEAGRPQNYRPEDIFFVTDSQFGFVAAVDGIMLRERPAANFYMGYFYAEALILAETGNLSGAIQIAGTDADTQIPFFITACDYTLMGEELYAASAYLSRHPTLLAQLKGQDIGKAIMTASLLLGVIVASMRAFGFDAIAEWVLGLFAT